MTDSKQQQATDPWSIWFFRLVQLVGLGSFIYELAFSRLDRPYILLVGLAMMLGGAGLQLITMWALRKMIE